MKIFVKKNPNFFKKFLCRRLQALRMPFRASLRSAALMPLASNRALRVNEPLMPFRGIIGHKLSATDNFILYFRRTSWNIYYIIFVYNNITIYINTHHHFPPHKENGDIFECISMLHTATHYFNIIGLYCPFLYQY